MTDRNQERLLTGVIYAAIAEHWGLIDSMTNLTVKGAEALADADCDEENTGD